MTKGIRDSALAAFKKHLPKVEKIGNTQFRANVIASVIAAHPDTSHASAAGAYNFALQTMRAEDPRAVAGIGREAAPAKKTSTKKTGVAAKRVTVVEARDTDTVVKKTDRATAEQLVAAATGRRGSPRLVILEDL